MAAAPIFVKFASLAASLAALACFVTPTPVHAQEASRPSATSQIEEAIADPRYVETHRFRIVNRNEGAIQISTDQGKTWRLIGRVLLPATTVAEGYVAAEYASPGTVAAIAVHGIRIRVSDDDPSLHAPLILSLDPKEYASRIPNKGYGGHRPGTAGIFTDMPAGAPLFRELAPMVGNMVLLESPSGKLMPLPYSFRPTGSGEVLIIPVRVPTDALTEVVFENKAGGAVTATFASGAKKQLTSVIQPVKGVGRFDGTSYTGVGRLNTAHTGVVTVSTAPVDRDLPEGEGRERRGGFQISPAWHNARTEEAGAPMVMTLGTPGPRQKEWEGIPPLFRDAVGLGWGADPDTSGIVDVAIDGGSWEPMPALIGPRLDGFTAAGLNKAFREKGIARTSKEGITAFRLRLPRPTPERARYLASETADQCAKEKLAAARKSSMPIVQGILTINANPTNSANVSFVRFAVEGVPKGFTNIAPFNVSWNTKGVPDGEYLIEAEALDRSGGVIATTRRRVYVLNRAETGKAATAAK